MRFLALPFLAATLVACGSSEFITCPAVSLPAVVVRVTDAATGEPLAEGTTALARDGAFADTLRQFEVNDALVLVSLAGASGRIGEYRVTAERAGYERWERLGVVVRSSGGECPQPVTAVLDARLERSR